LFLTTLFVFQGSSSGTPLLHRPRLRPWRATPQVRPAIPTPSSRYSDRDARSFKAEREETRRELGDVSKKAGIAKLEWEHQRKQLLEVIDGESCDLFNLNSTLK
jgi:hypothetical protein